MRVEWANGGGPRETMAKAVVAAVEKLPQSLFVFRLTFVVASIY